MQDAKQRIEEVGADAVMIGRAAMGNPYLFNQINHYFETGEILPDLTFEDKMKIAYEHLKRLINLKGEHIAVREFRGLAPHYLRGTPGAAKLRGAISQASTLAEIGRTLTIKSIETQKAESGTEIGNSLEFDFVVPPPHSWVGL